MALEVEHRASDSPYIARVWRGHSSGVERMTSVATSHWEFVVWSQDGRTRAAVRGPETAASAAEVPDDSASFGITFAHGTVMPHVPVARLVDAELESPQVTAESFMLRGHEWELPDFEDAEDVVDRLVCAGLLRRDPLVSDVIRGGPSIVGPRSVPRRVVAATGLSQGVIRRIERARQAAILLSEGAAPLDVVHRLGYYDQPHLARSLARFIGRTATQLRRDDAGEPLSLLYKTVT